MNSELYNIEEIKNGFEMARRLVLNNMEFAEDIEIALKTINRMKITSISNKNKEI